MYKNLGMGRLSSWTLNAITCIYVRRRQREIWLLTDIEEGDMKLEAETE